jgi:hypothetical protein
MALARLATAFRIVSPESLLKLLPPILNSQPFDSRTDLTDNGYIYWYSMRAIQAFVSSKVDIVLAGHLTAFSASRDFVFQTFKAEILPTALARLAHNYPKVRRTAALVVGEIFLGTAENRESFIESLLPKADDKWIVREGHLAAISACLKDVSAPLENGYNFVD